MYQNKRYTHTAGDETNLCMKAPQTDSDTAGQSTATADLSALSLEIVEYREKSIAVFGGTKPIKDVLRDLNGLFRADLTYKGERRAGWIYSKKKEQKVREALATCIRV